MKEPKQGQLHEKKEQSQSSNSTHVKKSGNANSENKGKDNLDDLLGSEYDDDDRQFNILACYYQSDGGHEEVTSGVLERKVIENLSCPPLHVQHKNSKPSVEVGSIQEVNKLATSDNDNLAAEGVLLQAKTDHKASENLDKWDSVVLPAIISTGSVLT
ncbi:hypothetical protein ABZP36_001376 [Zizania latifolia]